MFVFFISRWWPKPPINLYVTSLFLRKHYSSMGPTAKSFQLLGVDQKDSSEEDIKKAYITLVKKYHPDSKTPHASAEKFAEVREAYKRCVAYCKNTVLSREIQDALEKDLLDLDRNIGFTRKHQILPHRQYLSYDMGPGTHSQRQKAHAQHRLSEAMDSVYEQQFQKALENTEEKQVGPPRIDHWAISSRKVTKTTELIANEIIRDTMSRGGFQRLRGQGKPLRTDISSPVLDNLDMKLNEILRNAGFAPEWIMEEKDIRNDIDNLKKLITTCWNMCGPHPMSPAKLRLWEDYIQQFKSAEKSINKKIDSFNLTVPILNKQRAHINLHMLIDKVCSNEPVRETEVETQSKSSSEQRSDPLTDYLRRAVKWLFGSSN